MIPMQCRHSDKPNAKSKDKPIGEPSPVRRCKILISRSSGEVAEWLKAAVC